MTTLVTPSIVAKEALITLENNMVMANLVHRGYSDEYHSQGDTVIVRKPTTFTAANFTSAISTATITESSVAVVMNQLWDVSFEITSKELSLSVVDFNEQFLVPAVQAIAQAVDSTIFALGATAIAAHYPVTSTPVVADIAGLEAVLSVNKVPLTDRRLVFCPVTRAGYMSLDSFLNADKRGDGPNALREAELGRVLGFDTYVDQNVTTVTTGYQGATGLLAGAWAAAATTGTIDTVLSGCTVLAGDLFKVTGYDEWFRIGVQATATAATSLIISFSPAVKGTLADNAVVTFAKTHRANLAFHKNAWAFVSAPLQPPIGGAKAAVMSYNNLACRVVYGYTQASKSNLISVDFLCGFKLLDKELAARLIDQN